jgi:hypothetical protein
LALSTLIPVASASSLEAEALAANAAQQASPVIQGLAAHVRERWELAKSAKNTPEQRLLQCLRQRNGEYDPDKLAAIRAQGGSEIYMMLTSTKCRGASSWLRDTLLGTGADKPWTLDCTPLPDLPPDVQRQALGAINQAVQMMIQNTGQMPSEEVVRVELEKMRDGAMRVLFDEAKKRVERMETKMEDQLIEGRFIEGLTEFIDDIVTFPTAIMKGPVPRKRKTLEWKNGGLVPVEKITLEWERVDPFKAYPAPWASDIQDSFFIERHKLTRENLEAMIGVDGYSDAAINSVLANFGSGMTELLSVDTALNDATGKDSAAAATESSDAVDALQLWDSVQGSLLVEWGMDAKLVPDANKSYPCEIWLIGSTVIKAVLNYDPLGRKPYYAASYEKVPGAFWGNGVADLIRDCQSMCNAAARALSNNMGIASGPQVGLNVSRMPPGENVTSMTPWRIWQFQNTDFQDASKPIEFFQPQSNATELMGVFEKFQMLADEYSGIPRYMTGEQAPGAGRTASGLSMMISNASKSIKSVISSIDHHVISPLLQRLYQHNLRYSQDPYLIGDINIVSKGAMSLVAKESAAVRRAEFLQLALTNPMAQQIMGVLGTAELLRDHAKLLDMNVDKIVPTREALEAQQKEQAAQQQQLIQLSMQPETETVEFFRNANGEVVGGTKIKPRIPDIPGMQQKSSGGGLSLPKPTAKDTQQDGSPSGGRAQNQMVNQASGRTG